MAKRVRAPKARVRKPRTKPMLGKTKKKSTKKKKADDDLRVVKPRKTEVRTYILDTFVKKGKKPPVRYRRPVPRGMVKLKLSHMEDKKINTGLIIEFKYGNKQKPGQVGGWKNDPRPVILVFHDDKIKYVEGVNTNYLSEYYVKKLRTIMKRFPGVDGEQLYNIFKRTAKFALTKGYRKYIRASLKDTYVYVYEDEVERTIDALAKEDQTSLGTADRAKNAER